MKLSDSAFLPQRPINENERRAFIKRRDGLYEVLSPEEQQCVLQLAAWYAKRSPRLVPKIGLLERSSHAVANRLLYPLHGLPEPGALTRKLADLNLALSKIEDGHSKRLHEHFVHRIVEGSRASSTMETTLGVLLFFRLLPFELGLQWTRGLLEKRIRSAAELWLKDPEVPPTTRMRALVRSLEHQENDRDLLESRRVAWQLLLEVLNGDAGVAVNVVDEHWKPSVGSKVFFPLYLHDAPELAYQLALGFRSQRREFSEEMLRQAIYNTGAKLLGTDRSDSLKAVVDRLLGPMCALLFEWVLDTPGASLDSCLRSLDHLFRYGDPRDAYWPKLPSMVLAMVEHMSPDELGRWLHLVAAAGFYSEEKSPTGAEALRRFAHQVTNDLSPSNERGISNLAEVAGRLDKTLDLLESKTLARRNRHVPANAGHILMEIFEQRLGAARDSWFDVNSSKSMQNLVALTLCLKSEHLIRRHHEILREIFPRHVTIDPEDAALALKTLIQYRGYSQLEDQMYRKLLCQETFDALLPLLEAISPTQAAVARSGIGWSPRGDV